MLLATLALVGCAAVMETPAVPTPAKSIYDFTVTNIDGKDVKLSKFKGKVLMIVNVASKCGNTPQYAILESMYAKYKDKGFVILGFPANQFGHQEPGTNAEIKEFCTATYHVNFPMFSKIVVKGDGINPLYSWLIAHSDTPNQDIQWNFEKFIVDRTGKVIKRIAPRTKPDEADVVATVESALQG
ncbi:MAG: glutathione peroxidase [Fimbriimonadaceae bacterium]